MSFRPAARKNAKARIALSGPAGSGKTFSAIQLAKALNPDVGLIDSERESSEKYARKANTPEGPGNWDFRVSILEQKTCQEYMRKIGEAAAAGIPVCVIDSWTHAWLKLLEQVDAMGGWVKAGKVVSPLYAKLVDTMLAYPGHVIVTLRSKIEHTIRKDEKTGKTVVEKVGMATVAREGTDYEFDIMFDLALDGSLSVTKSRCPALSGQIFTRDDFPRIAATIKAWLDEGATESPRDTLRKAVDFAATEAALVELAPQIKALAATDREGALAILDVYRARKLAFQTGAVPQGDAEFPE